MPISEVYQCVNYIHWEISEKIRLSLIFTFDKKSLTKILT